MDADRHRQHSDHHHRETASFVIDPILGMVFGNVLLVASWGINRDSLSVLMEDAPLT
jgi:cobalt-zinc-cadmium efflux system protein